VSQPIVFSGPSGVGKDTLLEAWFARNDRLKRVVTCTTRQPREGELSGVDYHFCAVPEFEELVREDKLLEHKNVHGNLYGSPKADVEQMMKQGLWPVLKIDVQGGLEVIEKLPQCISIFVLPPSREELAQRLRQRGTDDATSIELRLKNAEEELKAAERYAHQVVNDQVGRAVDELEQVLRGYG
jgi:guanylate kinase